MVAVNWQFNKPDAYYHWLIVNLIKTNLQFIYSSSELTIEQKSEINLGHSYTYLKLLKESTPEDAVLLFPDAQIFSDQSNKVQFKFKMDDKGFVSYFLYPRQVIYEKEKIPCIITLVMLPLSMVGVTTN